MFRLVYALARVFWRGYTTVLAIPMKKPPKPALKALRRTNPKDASTDFLALAALLSKNKNTPVGPADVGSYLANVTAITISDAIDIKHLLQRLASSGVPHHALLEDEVLLYHVPGPEAALLPREVMVLANGTIVGWGLQEEYMVKKLVPPLAAATASPCKYESEEMDYVEVDAHENSPASSYMQGDVLVVPNRCTRERQLDMAAFAIGLSRSTRLSVLEESLETIIHHTRDNSAVLTDGFRIRQSQQEILRVTGHLFKLRAALNLYSELIETPDLYWSEPTLEKIYEAVSRRLDVPLRISIMNRKLDYLTDEQRALLSFLNERKGTRLEWIIILLILVEVLIEIVPFVARHVELKRERD